MENAISNTSTFFLPDCLCDGLKKHLHISVVIHIIK